MRLSDGKAVSFPLRGALIACIVAATGSPVGAVPSPRRAFFLSLLLPGWGQSAVGTPKRAVVFASIEGAFIASGLGFRAMRGVYEDDYRAFAASVAGANVEGKGKSYFSDLAFYETRLQHNQVARTFDQPEPILYGDADDWQWPTTQDRLRFRHRYNRAKTMDQRISYVLFAISLNHLASAIDAARQAGKRRRAEGTASRRGSLRFVADPQGGGRVVWKWAF